MKSFFRGTDKQLALIPKEVEVNKADKRDKVRKSVWRQIFDLITMGLLDKNEFEQGSLHEMKHGRAPRCTKGQRTGNDYTDMKYQIHHKKPRNRGGDNDKKNLVITSPRYHKTTLDPKYHYGEKHGKNRTCD